jgi:hypothetical protein
MHVEVKELSPVVRKALEGVSYGARDIEIIPARTVEPTVAGGKGQRGFATFINLDTGQSERVMGSWGGSNPWSESPVDGSNEKIAIPINGAVIKGTMGHPRTYAWIYAHPTAVGAYLLPSGEDKETLTDEEQNALYCFGAIKGGEYRRDEMRRRNVRESTVDSLVERGYLKRSKNGATQITTRGKNARNKRY